LYQTLFKLERDGIDEGLALINVDLKAKALFIKKSADYAE
jgi:hypothetical protein